MSYLNLHFSMECTLPFKRDPNKSQHINVLRKYKKENKLENKDIKMYDTKIQKRKENQLVKLNENNYINKIVKYFITKYFSILVPAYLLKDLLLISAKVYLQKKFHIL